MTRMKKLEFTTQMLTIAKKVLEIIAFIKKQF